VQVASPQSAAEGQARDERYFELLAGAIRICARYRPMFGKGRRGGMSVDDFQEMYRADPFYNWMGLDSPLIYAAHRAAGGMTSIYRQVGIGCQWIFSALLQDCLGLTPPEAGWTYTVPAPDGKPRPLYLDGRIDFEHVRAAAARQRVERWLASAADRLLLTEPLRDEIRGVVFEVRQGYKSKDSKRQNADISNASNAYASLYVPALALFSTQIDADVASRYIQARWLLLTGAIGGSPTDSTYVFCREVLLI
jgi:hypothetical protein